MSCLKKMALFARATANKSLFVNNYCNKLTIINAISRKLSGFSRNCLLLRRSRGSVRYAAPFSEMKETTKPPNTFKNERTNKEMRSFDELLSVRRSEADRSIIVQVESPDSYADLYSYCRGFGSINNVLHYVINDTSYFFIIEFVELGSQRAVINAATHLNHSQIIPTQTQLLWFRNITKRKQRILMVDDLPQLLTNVKQPTNEIMTEALSTTKSISEQIKTLYNIWKLDDVGFRLRFLTAHQMETCFTSLFPNIKILPFGSSVNGFGKKGCDLDLVLNLEPDRLEKNDSRLVFHTKGAMSEERAQTQRSMDTIGSLIQNFIPGVINVRKILRATVPIIKYDHKLTGLECDLSMTNLTAIYMSELLFLYGETHCMVRPLVFTIRQWAASVGITKSQPGHWITNFSLSLMVLFYLQYEKILPSINTLKNKARTSDIRLTDTCVDCTFLRDITKWPAANSIKNETLESLLGGFFNFYASFDYTTQAISLREGTSMYKPDASPLYICNPLEKMLNVSKNVNTMEVMRLINSVRNAAMLMNERNPKSRGLLDIFAEKCPQQKNVSVGRTDKKLRIVDLFQTKHNSNNGIINNVRDKSQNTKRR